MESKNGLKIVCDSGAGFSTEQAVFLANNLAKKMRSLKPRFYVSTSKSIIKALINMHSFEIQLSPIG